MPLIKKKGVKSKALRKPPKQEQPTKPFKRKVKTKSDITCDQKLTMREAAMVAAYHTLKTVPLSMVDIAAYSGLSMTTARQDSAEAHFDKIMERALKPIVRYFDRKGLSAYLEKVCPPTPFAEEYADQGEEE